MTKQEFLKMLSEAVEKELKAIIHNTNKCDYCKGEGWFMSADGETPEVEKPLQGTVYKKPVQKVSCKKCNGTGLVRPVLEQEPVKSD
jgi:DnaJ-class molecular chaperone